MELGNNGIYSANMYTKILFNKTKSSNLYPLTKGCVKEICKSQNINPIYIDPKFTFDIIQIITKF